MYDLEYIESVILVEQLRIAELTIQKMTQPLLIWILCSSLA